MPHVFTDDRRWRGGAVIATMSLVFTYFTLWVIVVPLFEDNARESLDSLVFPADRFYALAVPTAAGVLLVTLVALSLGFTVVKEGCSRW
mmetsp:Transcript_874/g.2029  ORF Transcript_874/g.2029 Transcript_874/m.2029 type:complete len:89 (-) Transcript_874:1261-1527(-)